MSVARRLWTLALPLMLANSSIALLGLVDTAVIGHLDDEQYLAGVAIATILFDFLYWGVTFLRMGTTGVVAQNYGARDSTGFRTAFFDALVVALLIGSILVAFRIPIMHFCFSFVNGSESALFQASIYYKIKVWGAPGVLGAMVIVGWLVGMQNARAALVLAAVPSALNALLDYLFVVEFGMGVAGAATGSKFRWLWR